MPVAENSLKQNLYDFSVPSFYIPDEMRVISDGVWSKTSKGKFQLTVPGLNMSKACTGKGRFYVSNYNSDKNEVCADVEIKKVTYPGQTMNAAEFDQRWDRVFFYGKEVNDFHTLDKNQIFALHHSAIQELSRRNDEKTARIEKLEADIAAIKQAVGI